MSEKYESKDLTSLKKHDWIHLNEKSSFTMVELLQFCNIPYETLPIHQWKMVTLEISRINCY